MITIHTTQYKRTLHWMNEFCYYTWKKQQNLYDIKNKPKCDFCAIYLTPNEEKIDGYEPSFPHITVTGQEEHLITSTVDKNRFGNSLVQLNTTLGIKQWLETSGYIGTVHLVDPDVIFIYPFQHNIDINLPGKYCFGDDTPNNWHLFIHDENYNVTHDVIKRYCRKNLSAVRGIWVPLVIHSDQLREIIDRWIELTLAILQDDKLDHTHDGVISRRWWAQMYAFPIALAENEILPINHNAVNIPCTSDHDEKLGYCLHYAVSRDGAFNKRKFIEMYKKYPDDWISKIEWKNNVDNFLKYELSDFLSNYDISKII
jgi:hypothetical protein